MNKNIMIFGSTSAIAQEVAKLLAKQGNNLFLIGRNLDRLVSVADDLSIRSGKKVNYECCDLNDFDKHQNIFDKGVRVLGNVDIVLIAHGILSKQNVCEKEFDYAHEVIKTNLISNISLLTIIANYFEKRKQGSIAVISSVAGDRGRQSNYIYGTSKAGLNTFLQGLRNRLSRSNVNVLTIKPGFVDTPMTKDFKKGLLWVNSDRVAKKIVKAIKNNNNEIYVPNFWYWIMLIIKLIPERIFCKLRL